MTLVIPTIREAKSRNLLLVGAIDSAGQPQIPHGKDAVRQDNPSCRISGVAYFFCSQTLLLTNSANPPSGALPNWSSWVAFLLTTKRPLWSRV